MTNGELFQALYPNIVVKENVTCMWLYFGKDEYTHYTMPTSWWNEEAPSLPQDDTECIYCKHCFEGSEFENATPQPQDGDLINRASAMTEIMMSKKLCKNIDGDIYIKVTDATEILLIMPSVSQTDVNSIIAEQALKVGSNWTECHAPTHYDKNDLMELSPVTPCEDLISRQAVLDLVNSDWKYEGLESDIQNMPSAEKTGHWITLKDEYGDVYEAVCSNCDSNGNHKWAFCPSCGARMFEPQERSE